MSTMSTVCLFSEGLLGNSGQMSSIKSDKYQLRQNEYAEGLHHCNHPIVAFLFSKQNNQNVEIGAEIVPQLK